MVFTIDPVQTEGDRETVATLADSIWRDHYSPIIGIAQVEYMLNRFQSAEAIEAQCQAGYVYCLVQQDAVAVGYFAVQQQAEDLFLSKFYVVASERGQGYGRQMLAEIEQIARGRGCDRITLTVNKHNTTTLQIYQRLGFTVTDAIVTDIGGGFVMDDFLLVKKLTHPG